MPVKVVYIAGSGRSGSTMLDALLGQLPGFRSCGQIYSIWNVAAFDQLCGCGHPVPQCDFWSRVLARLDIDPGRYRSLRDIFRQATKPSQVPHVLLTGRPRLPPGQFEEAVRITDTLYQAIADISGASVLVDSSKKPIYLSLLARHTSVELFVIHLVRDSRGVAYSQTKKKKLAPGVARTMHDYPPWSIALKWYVNLLPEFMAPRRDLFVRYEDFVRDPSRFLADIAQRVTGAAVDLDFLHEERVELQANHAVEGNPVRFNTGKVELRVDEDWKSKLPTTQRRLVTLINAPLLKHYGYPLDWS